MASVPSNYPDWQSQAGYPSYGVGDLNDLKFLIFPGEGGRWLGYNTPGYYYAEGLEQYAYADKGTLTYNVTSATGTLFNAVSFRPALGPIYVREGTGTIYTEHHSCFQPAVAANWALVSNNVYVTDVATGYMLSGVRDLTLTPLFNDSATGTLTDKSYYFDEVLSKLYVYSKTSTVNKFVDLVTLQPLLRVREILKDEGGYVLPSYKDISSVVLSRGYDSLSLVGTPTGNLNHTFNTSPGDWVCAEYYIRKSFAITDHNTLIVYTSEVSGNILTVEYEKSNIEYPNLTLQAYPVSGSPLQFNPSFSDSFRAGYLYHSNTSTTGTPYRINLNFEKKVVCGGFNEMFKVHVKVLDKEGIPLAKIPITLSHNIASNNTIGLVPTYSTMSPSGFVVNTDNRGEINWLMQAPTGVASIVLKASHLTLQASGTISNQTSSTALSTANYLKGNSFIIQSTEYSPRGFLKLYASKNYLDGIPKINTEPITIISKNGAGFEYVGTDLASSTGVKSVVAAPEYSLTNFCGVIGKTQLLGAVIGDVDQVFTISGSGQSPISTIFQAK